MAQPCMRTFCLQPKLFRTLREAMLLMAKFRAGVKLDRRQQRASWGVFRSQSQTRASLGGKNSGDANARAVLGRLPAR